MTPYGIRKGYVLAEPADLKLGPFEFHPSLDDSTVTDLNPPPIPPTAEYQDVVVGAPFFEQGIVTIDYRRDTVTVQPFERKDWCPNPLFSGHFDFLSSRNHMPIVPISIDGHTGRALFDTGSAKEISVDGPGISTFQLMTDYEQSGGAGAIVDVNNIVIGKLTIQPPRTCASGIEHGIVAGAFLRSFLPGPRRAVSHDDRFLKLMYPGI